MCLNWLVDCVSEINLVPMKGWPVDLLAVGYSFNS